MKTVTIIIPTHNRSASLHRMLQKIGAQSYPAQLMEVVVVADGCNDDTVAMLQSFDAPFALKYAATEGCGAAAARNRGASIATGEVLLFLDDDIDPAETLVEAHVAEGGQNRVIIGYLPLLPPKIPGFFAFNLRTWWEQKFFEMAQPGYRYSYEDLLSGNFSLSAQLFRQVNGFDTQLRCREDYELGLRLIKAGAAFHFSKNAWGFHCDESTTLHRSFLRKKEEGIADVQFWQTHPQIRSSLQVAFQKHGNRFLQSPGVLLVEKIPWLTDAVANTAEKLLQVLERLKLRSRWQQINATLHNYWYLRGLMSVLKTRKALLNYLRSQCQTPCNAIEAIDLAKGWEAAEALLDNHRPAAVALLYGQQRIAELKPNPGAEPLQGKHLRPLLLKQFPDVVVNGLAFQLLQHSKSCNAAALRTIDSKPSSL